MSDQAQSPVVVAPHHVAGDLIGLRHASVDRGAATMSPRHAVRGGRLASRLRVSGVMRPSGPRGAAPRVRRARAVRGRFLRGRGLPALAPRHGATCSLSAPRGFILRRHAATPKRRVRSSAARRGASAEVGNCMSASWVDTVENVFDRPAPTALSEPIIATEIRAVRRRWRRSRRGGSA